MFLSTPLPGTRNPPRALCKLNDVNLLLEMQDGSTKSGLKVAGAAISGGSASCWTIFTSGLSLVVWSSSWLLKATHKQEHRSIRAMENGSCGSSLSSRVDGRLSLIYIILYQITSSV